MFCICTASHTGASSTANGYTNGMGNHNGNPLSQMAASLGLNGPHDGVSPGPSGGNVLATMANLHNNGELIGALY